MASSHITIDVRGMPELMAELRAELACLLREVAEDEAPRVAERIRSVAAIFECGQSEDPA